jgi:hypothetical protein
VLPEIALIAGRTVSGLSFFSCHNGGIYFLGTSINIQSNINAPGRGKYLHSQPHTTYKASEGLAKRPELSYFALKSA